MSEFSKHMDRAVFMDKIAVAIDSWASGSSPVRIIPSDDEWFETTGQYMIKWKIKITPPEWVLFLFRTPATVSLFKDSVKMFSVELTKSEWASVNKQLAARVVREKKDKVEQGIRFLESI